MNVANAPHLQVSDLPAVGSESEGFRIIQPMKLAEQTWPEGTAPVVSICCTTYNHEKYIRECLDGFLMQETAFPVEILINDDASTDRTADIIREYESKYPNIIKPIYQTENKYSKGIRPNITFNFPRAKGDYIALCEGDDYWIDSQKLEKQILFMEAHSDYTICFHKAMVLDQGKLVVDYITSPPKESTAIIDLAEGNYIHTPTCVFKNRLTDIMREHCHQSPIGDYYFHCMNAQYGKIFYFDEPMAVYRAHNESVWSNKSQAYREHNTLLAIQAIMADLDSDQTAALEALCRHHIRLSLSLASNAEESLAIDSLILDKSSIYSKQLAYLLLTSNIQLRELQSGLHVALSTIALLQEKLNKMFSYKIASLSKAVKQNIDRHIGWRFRR